MPEDRQPSPDKIMNVGLGFWASKALLSAVELGLFTELSQSGPLGAEALRERLGLHPRSSPDFFDTLVALGFLEREDGRYRNGADGELFLVRGKPTYMGGILEMANRRLYGFWGSLTEALRTGAPQNEARDGRKPFEAIYASPEGLRGFLEAMSGISLGNSIAIAEKFSWTDHQTVIDVGCAQGLIPVQIAKRHAHIGGGGFDLPQVAPIFEEFVAGHGLSDRLRFHPGDFFSDDLPRADVLVMGHILHDWGLEDKMRLLEKAHRALPAGGALIVYESIIDDERRENAFGLLMSLNMIIETDRGFDFTGRDCMGWMKEVGFSETRVEPLVGPDSMVIGVK